MRSPWDSMDRAFECMFTDVVTITSADGTRQTVRCVVFRDGMDEPILDDAVTTDRRTLSFAFPKAEMSVAESVDVGDKVDYLGRTYTVMSRILDEVSGWVVKARS